MKSIIKSEGTQLILSMIVSLILFILCVANIESKLEPVPHYLMVGGVIISSIYFFKFYFTYEKIFFVLWQKKSQRIFKLCGNGLMLSCAIFLIFTTPQGHPFVVLFRVLVFWFFLYKFVKAFRSNEN